MFVRSLKYVNYVWLSFRLYLYYGCTTLGVVPRAQTIIGITATFMFHNFFSILARSCFFYFFFYDCEGLVKFLLFLIFLLGVVPSAQTIIGVTATFMFDNLFSILARSFFLFLSFMIVKVWSSFCFLLFSFYGLLKSQNQLAHKIFSFFEVKLSVFCLGLGNPFPQNLLFTQSPLLVIWDCSKGNYYNHIVLRKVPVV